MRFLNLILILLMWTEAVFAVSTTDNNKVVGKTLKVALEYVTSMSKIDGSFESGNTGWVASVGTITPTASTEFQGNYKGLWSATGAGTLDLQWTATASNTYEASAIVSVDGADSDHYVCAVVNGVETGCTLFDGPGYTPNKQIKVSVVADSVKGASFYLRIKHTGTDAFNLSIDDGKIQPWTAQTVQTVDNVDLQITTYAGTTLAGNSYSKVLFQNPNVDTHSGWSNVNNRYVCKKSGHYNVASSVTSQQVTLSNGVYQLVLFKNGSFFSTLNYGYNSTISGQNVIPLSGATSVQCNVGDYLEIFVQNPAATTSTAQLNAQLSITATAVRDNVIQSYQEGSAFSASFGIVNNTVLNTTFTKMPLLKPSQVSDSSSMIDTVNNKILIKDSGTYLLSGTFVVSNITANHSASIGIYKNGAFWTTIGGGSGIAGINSLIHISQLLDVKKDDYLEIYVNISAGTAVFYYDGQNGIAGISKIGTRAPTLLALPTRSEVFSASISASGVATNATQNFVTSCTNVAPSVCTLWSNFGVTPICWATPIDITKRAEVTTTSTTSLTVGRTDTSTAFNLFCHLK